jgi:hypothetical protein
VPLLITCLYSCSSVIRSPRRSLRSHGNLLPAFRAPAFEDVASSSGRHALPEAVCPLAPCLMGLIGPLQFSASFHVLRAPMPMLRNCSYLHGYYAPESPVVK